MSRSVLESLLIAYARHFPLRMGKLRVVNSLWHAATRGRGAQRVTDLTYGGFRMPCDLNEMLQRQFYFFGTYFVETDILGCWEIAARGASVIMDVGANAGIYSLAALAAQPGATVHAFEPTPEIATRLRTTAYLNRLDRLYVHEVAVFCRNGKAILRRCRGDLGTNEGMNFISPEVDDSGAEWVRTVCLDSFCEDQSIERIDLLKLDIQGHEHSALAGAGNLIGAGRVGMIFLELNWVDTPGNGCPAMESIRLLGNAGYVFSQPRVRLNWKAPGDWLRSLTDVVALSPRCDKISVVQWRF